MQQTTDQSQLTTGQYNYYNNQENQDHEDTYVETTEEADEI